MKQIIVFALALTMVASLSFGFSSGPPDGYCGNPPAFQNCTVCHISFPVNSGNGTLSITAPTTYVPGVTYDIAVHLEDQDQSRWGFELTTMDASNHQAGTIVITDPTNTQLSNNPIPMPDFIKHTSAGTHPGTQSGTWQFQWNAPESTTGTVTFYFAGNAANNSGDPLGDYIYTSTHTVEEGSPVSIDPIGPKTYQLLSNYPNPFNPTTTLTFTLEQPGNVQLIVYDVMGRQVASLANGQMQSGTYRVGLDGSRLASGNYIARLVTPNGTMTRMLTLVK
jgi:hypothetical protein